MRDINNQFEKHKISPRVTITDDEGNAVTFGENTDYGRVYEISINVRTNSDSRQATMSFRNHEEYESLDPLDSTSDFNNGTIANNLMDRYHNVEIELSKDGGSNYYTVFEGFVGDITSTREASKNDIIEFSPYDKSKPLKDTIILENAPNQPYVYEAVDALDCADEILSDNGFDLTINRTASDNPQKAVSEYRVKNTTPWEAIKEIFAQTGYKVMFKWGGSSYDLVVIDPERGEISSVDHSFNGDFSARRIEHSDKNVRSKVTVFYIDRGGGTRERVSVSDSDVLDKYGAKNYNNQRLPREMVLKEDDKSLIDTEVEAKAYANAALNDLSTPTPDTEITFKANTVLGLELYDRLEFGGVGDYTLQIGTTSIDYTFSASNPYGQTTIRGAADKVIGNPNYFLNKGQLPDDIDAQKGDRSPPPKPENPPRLEKTTYNDQTGTTRVKVVCYGEHNPAWDVEGYQFRYRIKNTKTDDINEWKYPDQVKNPQKTITGLEIGEELKLEVQYSAIDWENEEWSGLPGDSPYSDAGSISLYVDIVPPGQPQNLTAEAGPERIALNWNPVTQNKDGSELNDLNTYYVYRATSSGISKDDETSYEEKEQVDADSWQYETSDTTTTYVFAITAEDNSGNESILSNEVGPISADESGESLADGFAPSMPTNLSVSDQVKLQDDGTAVGRLQADWDEVTTNVEGNTTDDIKGYEVAICDSTNNTCDITSGTLGSSWDIASSTESPETLLGGLDVGVTYDVVVRTYDYEEKYSGWTSAVSQTINTDTTIPNPPSSITAQGSPEGIVVEWAKPTQNTDGSNLNDLRSILVYYNDSSGINVTDDTTYSGIKKVDGEEWLHNLTGEETKYYKATAIDDSGNESSSTIEVSATANVTVGDHTPPDIPTGLSIATNKIDHQDDGTVYAIVGLQWDDNTESDLKGYEVGVSEDDTNWNTFASTESSEYTIKPLKPNSTYYFRIRSVDTEQNKSDWTTSVSTTTAQDTTAPSTPSWKTTAVEEKTDSVVFHWQEVTANDLSYYEIAVDVGNDGNFDQTYQHKTTDFTVYGSTSTTFGAKVRAVDHSGNKSDYTTVKSGSPKIISGDGVTPSAPTGLSLSTSLVEQPSGEKDAQITATWDENSEDDLRGYEIQISNDGTSWEGWGKVREAKVQIGGMQQNATKYIRIRAEDIEDKSSDWTQNNITTAEDNTAPSTPSWKTTAIEEKTDSVVFHWQEVTDSDLSYYEIAVDQGNDGSFENTYQHKTTDFTVYGAPGTQYAAKIRAVDTSGNSSSYTTIKSGTPKIISGDNATPSDPTGLSLSTSLAEQPTGEKSAQITATWDENSESDLRGYEIQISTDGTNWEGWGKIREAKVRIGSLQQGVTRYVRIRAEDIEDKNSGWTSSNIVTASDSTAPSTPSWSSVAVETTVGGVIFHWQSNSEDDLDYYEIRTDQGNDGSFENTYTLYGTDFTAYGSSGTTFGAEVRAVDTSGNASSWSTKQSGTADSAGSLETPIGAGDWSYSGQFSALDYDTVEWGSGTLTLNNGDSYSISSSDTGAMSNPTYIYFDTNTSTTAFQTTTTASNAVGSNKIIVCTAVPSGDTSKNAEFQVFSGASNVGISSTVTADVIAGNTITASEIASNTITAGLIEADTITASEISGDTITATEIASTTITASEIDSNTITANEISADTMTLGEMAFSSDDNYVDQSVLEIGGTVTFASGYNPNDTRAVIRQDTEPTSRPNGDSLKSGDMWIDTNNGDKPYSYDTSTSSFTEAYTIINGGDIETGTLTATQISADTITLGEVAFSSDDTYIDQSDIEIGGSVTFISGYDISDARTVIRQSSEPSQRPSGDPLQDGDVWVDTDTNIQYTYDSSSSSFVQNALGEGNITIRQDTEPSTRPDGSSLQSGDMWIDTDDGDKPYTYNGSSFIQAYTIINGGNIETGTVTATQINTDTITATEIAADTITASQISSNTITATQISADTMTLGEMAFSSDDTYVDQSVLEIGGTVTFATGYNPNDTRAVIRSDTEPTSRPNGDSLKSGDMWIDTNNGDKPYSYDTSISSFTGAYTIINGGNIETGTLTATQISADTITLGEVAFSSDDNYINQSDIEIGGSVSFTSGYDPSDTRATIRQTSEPTQRPSGDPLETGDMWIDTDDGDKPYTYNGTNFIEAYTIINGGNIDTGTITATQIDSGTITATEISANTITANEIDSNTITANQIAADSITVDVLDIASQLNISSGGAIAGGATDYVSGTGFWLGEDTTDSTWKFFIGDDTGNSLEWNGSTLDITGEITITDFVSGPDMSTTDPTSSGLYMNANYLGYHNGTSWNSYIASSGDFYFADDTGSNYLEWDSSAGNFELNANMRTATSGSQRVEMWNSADIDTNWDHGVYVADESDYWRIALGNYPDGGIEWYSLTFFEQGSPETARLELRQDHIKMWHSDSTEALTIDPSAATNVFQGSADEVDGYDVQKDGTNGEGIINFKTS